jgi:hypothetical protein
MKLPRTILLSLSLLISAASGFTPRSDYIEDFTDDEVPSRWLQIDLEDAYKKGIKVIQQNVEDYRSLKLIPYRFSYNVMLDEKNEQSIHYDLIYVIAGSEKLIKDPDSFSGESILRLELQLAYSLPDERYKVYIHEVKYQPSIYTYLVEPDGTGQPMQPARKSDNRLNH